MKIMTSFVFVVFLIAYAVTWFSKSASDSEFMKTAEKTIATVTEVRKSYSGERVNFYVNIVFSVNGQEVSTMIKNIPNPQGIGVDDRIIVYYDPNNPEDARASLVSVRYTVYGLICLGFASILLFGGYREIRRIWALR